MTVNILLNFLHFAVKSSVEWFYLLTYFYTRLRMRIIIVQRGSFNRKSLSRVF